MVSLRVALAFALVLAACTKPEEPPPPRPASSAFSPEAAAIKVTSESPDGGLPIAKEADPTALAEIIAAAPTTKPTTTGPDGGTLVGTNTDVSPDEPGPDEPKGKRGNPPRVERGISIEEGKPDVAVGIPSPAVERAARAQLYHPLVMRCRGPDGKILPPDAIVVRFKIDPDGYLVPSSISASASDPRFDDAANCMRRELSSAAFRAPSASRGVASMVNATVPSVD